MVIGCAFLMIFGFEIFYEEFARHWFKNEEQELINKDEYTEGDIGVFTRRSLIFYEAFMTSACFFTLGALTLWHATLIHAGQTSIEVRH